MKYEIIKHYESLHDGDLKQVGLQPKMDCVGIWTEGWGHAMRDDRGNFIKGIKDKALAYSRHKINTIEEADKQLELDTASVKLIIARKIKVPLTENQMEALISFVYNPGGSATLYYLINTNSSNISDWWQNHYITADGIIQNGLIYRRESEALQFKTGIVKFFN